MFWIGFNFVFSLISNAAVGFIDFITLIVFVIGGLYLIEAIKKLIKSRVEKKNVEKGLLYGKHVVVTGGSSGIGKCVAILAAKQGAHVTIIARNLEKLQEAHEAVSLARRNKDSQKVECESLDVSAEYERVQRKLDEIDRRTGPIYMLVNCAGTAICGKIEDTTDYMVDLLVKLNLLGTYYCTKAVVPKMKLAKEGKIVIVSSQAGLLGIFGYSAYCSTKFALRGLAESLAMELTPHNVSVTLSLPPDTDTPGFAVEEQSKPLETKLIGQSAGLMQPEVVAEKLLNDALEGNFFSIVGSESFILTNLCVGMSPYKSLAQLLLQSLLMGPLRLISAFYLYSFEKIVQRCMEERETHKKPE